MAKKTFKSGLDSLLQTTRPQSLEQPTPLADLSAVAVATTPAVATPAEPLTKPTATPTAPKAPVETRATFIVDADQLETLRAYAYWERLQLKEALHQALAAFFDGKDIAPIPDGKKK